MLLNIKVIPNAKKNVIKREKDVLKIYVACPPENGRANKAVIKLLSKQLNIPKSKIEIIKGEKMREKIIKVQTI